MFLVKALTMCSAEDLLQSLVCLLDQAVLKTVSLARYFGEHLGQTQRYCCHSTTIPDVRRKW